MAPVYNDLQDVLDATTTPPASPSDGDSYLIMPTAIGVWTGNDNKIATWSGSAWNYYTPSNGNRSTVTTGPLSGYLYAWNGTAWTQYFAASNNWQLGGNSPEHPKDRHAQRLRLRPGRFRYRAHAHHRRRQRRYRYHDPGSLLSIGATNGINFTTGTSTFK